MVEDDFFFFSIRSLLFSLGERIGRAQRAADLAWALRFVVRARTGA
jgi:hypothetical protein